MYRRIVRNDNRRNRHGCNEYIDRQPFDRFDNHLAHIFCRKNIWHKTAIQSESYRNGEIGFAIARIRLRNNFGGIRSLASEQPPSPPIRQEDAENARQNHSFGVVRSALP